MSSTQESEAAIEGANQTGLPVICTYQLKLQPYVNAAENIRDNSCEYQLKIYQRMLTEHTTTNTSHNYLESTVKKQTASSNQILKKLNHKTKPE